MHDSTESGHLELKLHGARNLKLQNFVFKPFKNSEKDTMV
jgi:hypothetical protein